jgi:hypothetical protein
MLKAWLARTFVFCDFMGCFFKNPAGGILFLGLRQNHPNPLYSYDAMTVYDYITLAPFRMSLEAQKIKSFTGTMVG